MDKVNNFLEHHRECVFIVRLHGDPPRSGDNLDIVEQPPPCTDNVLHNNCVLKIPKKVYIFHTTPPSYNTWSDKTDDLVESFGMGIPDAGYRERLAAALFTCQLQSEVPVDYLRFQLRVGEPMSEQLFRYGQLYEPGTLIYNYNLHYEDNSEILQLADRLGDPPKIVKKMHCFCLIPSCF